MTDKTILAKVTAVRDDLANNLLERETAIDAAMLALLCGEHLLLLGPPGSAKSLLVRSICERITNTNLFEHLMTRFSVPEELFGPLSLSALEQDKYQRITSGSIVECHLANLDEIFKSNSAILNSLLGLINERCYFEGGQARKVPLLSLFGASNETPEDNGLDALFDRFLLRVQVPYLADDNSIRRLFDISTKAPSAVITLDELRAAQTEVNQVALTDEARDAIIEIKHGLEQEGVAASDRRWKACARLVCARAWLEGDTQTTADHCEVLVDALWSEPGQIRLVQRVVNRVASPLNLEAVELQDAAEDLFKQRPAPDSPQITAQLEPLLRQIADIHTRLETRIHNVPSKRSHRARQALHKVAGWHRTLSQLALRSLSSLHSAPGAS